jgi:hypothetical protein
MIRKATVACFFVLSAVLAAPPAAATGDVADAVVCGCSDSSGCYGPILHGEAQIPACAKDKVCTLKGHCVLPSYTVNGDGTVTDDRTGLVWQQDAPSVLYTWSDIAAPGSAQAYCASLSFAGGGWVVPTLSQLYSLAEFGPDPSIDSTVFPSTPGASFWSADPSTSVGEAWAVNFDDAYTLAWGTASSTLYVRCVK